MTNSDLARVINSDEIQTKVRGAIKTVTRFVRHKNPLKNFGQKVNLNPYAIALRRSELLTSERQKKAKALKIANARKGVKTPLNKLQIAQAKAEKKHRPQKAENFARILDFDAASARAAERKAKAKAEAKAKAPAKAAAKPAAAAGKAAAAPAAKPAAKK